MKHLLEHLVHLIVHIHVIERMIPRPMKSIMNIKIKNVNINIQIIVIIPLNDHIVQVQSLPIQCQLIHLDIIIDDRIIIDDLRRHRHIQVNIHQIMINDRPKEHSHQNWIKYDRK